MKCAENPLYSPCGPSDAKVLATQSAIPLYICPFWLYSRVLTTCSREHAMHYAESRVNPFGVVRTDPISCIKAVIRMHCGSA